jgi:hypothetical protein
MINRPDRFTALVLKIFQISWAAHRANGGELLGMYMYVHLVQQPRLLIYAAPDSELSLELLCPAPVLTNLRLQQPGFLSGISAGS